MHKTLLVKKIIYYTNFTGEGDYNTGLLGLYNTGQLWLYNTRDLKIWVWRKYRYNTRDLKILNTLTDWC